MRVLNGKTAVVTGGSRGIGRAIVLAYAKNGANVALLYADNRESAENTAEEARAFGVKVELYRCDVRSFEETKSVAAAILSEFSQVDILVNNAGITRDALMLSMDEASFDDVVDTSLKGAFNLTRHFYAHMMRRRSGRILNISSVAGLTGNAGQANYASAKAGLIGLTKTVAKELASRNITCNAIAPGYIVTDMTAKLPEKISETMKEYIPMKRFGSPEEVAQVALFLASDAAAYITGETIRVDGGMCI